MARRACPKRTRAQTRSWVLALALLASCAAGGGRALAQSSRAGGPPISPKLSAAAMETTLQAVQSARRRLQAHPKDAAAWLSLGEALAAGGDDAQAQTAVARALALDPRLCRGWEVEGQLADARQQWPLAAQQYQRAVQCEPRAAAPRFFLGEALLRLGELQAAETQLRAALAGGRKLCCFCAGSRQTPVCGPAALFIDVGLAQIARQLGDERTAAKELRAALALDRDDPEALISLAEIDLSSGRAQSAAAGFRQALRIEPDSVAAWSGLAAALRRDGEPQQSEEAFRQVRDLVRRNQARRQARQESDAGLLLWRQGKLADAADRFRRALAAAPDDASAYNNLGGVLSLMGDRAAAERAFAEAIHLRPFYPMARDNWGLVLLQDGKVAAAIEQFQTAVAEEPAYPAAHLNLAVALERKGDLAGAQTELRRAQRLAPASSTSAQAGGVAAAGFAWAGERGLAPGGCWPAGAGAATARKNSGAAGPCAPAKRRAKTRTVVWSGPRAISRGVPPSVSWMTPRFRRSARG